MTEKTFNKLFSIFILAGMTICVILSTLQKMQAPDARRILLAVTAFGALMGVCSTVLSANGSIWNFFFGILDVAIYSYILWDSKMPSQFLLHVCYILPMEFVGLAQWRKRGADGHKQVKAQRLRGKAWWKYIGLFLVVFAGAFTISWFVLNKAGEPMNYSKMVLDATVTTANIVALVMMAFAYMEQWYLWTLVNLSSVVLWSITLATSPDSGYAVIPLVKYIFYFINGINGIRIWLSLSKSEA